MFGLVARLKCRPVSPPFNSCGSECHSTRTKINVLEKERIHALLINARFEVAFP